MDLLREIRHNPLFWLLALVLFYLPSAAVVIYLNNLMPLEGGLYQWAKLGFNQTVGFLLAWTLVRYRFSGRSTFNAAKSQPSTYSVAKAATW